MSLATAADSLRMALFTIVIAAMILVVAPISGLSLRGISTPPGFKWTRLSRIFAVRRASSFRRFFASFHCFAGIALNGCAAGAITGPSASLGSSGRPLGQAWGRGPTPPASSQGRAGCRHLRCHEVFLEELFDDLVLNDMFSWSFIRALPSRTFFGGSGSLPLVTSSQNFWSSFSNDLNRFRSSSRFIPTWVTMWP